MQRPAANPPRLGRVECAILDALHRADGCIQREGLVEVVYSKLQPATRQSATTPKAAQDARMRAHAHATVSRAIVSLVRKQLIVRERYARTGRTFLRCAELTALPIWEEIARAEEDFAAHCGDVAKKWTALARRSQLRAAQLRAEHSVDGTEGERRDDLAAIAELEGKHRATRRFSDVQRAGLRSRSPG